MGWTENPRKGLKTLLPFTLLPLFYSQNGPVGSAAGGVEVPVAEVVGDVGPVAVGVVSFCHLFFS